MSEQVALSHGTWVYGNASANILWTEEEYEKRIAANEQYISDLKVIRDHARNSDIADAIEAYSNAAPNNLDLPEFVRGYMAAKNAAGEGNQ